MSNDLVVFLSKQMLWQAFFLCLPIGIAAVLCGVGFSILQVATQIQDSSISTIPKIAAVLLVLSFSCERMLQAVLTFATQIFKHIPEYLLW